MSFHDDIAIGAGHAGVHMGYFLEAADREYLILEREVVFRSTLSPRQRRLKSINTRFNWHFLLTRDHAIPLLGYWTYISRWARELAQYLRGSRDHSGIALVFETGVARISRDPEWPSCQWWLPACALIVGGDQVQVERPDDGIIPPGSIPN